MHTLKSYIKYYIALAFRHLGVYKPERIRNILNSSGGILIPVYHSVHKEPEAGLIFEGTPYTVSLETFCRQINVLNKYFTPISLVDFEAHLFRQKTLPKRPCLITFDDGWRNNYTTVYPAMVEMGTPFTVFLATGLVGTKRLFWTHHLWSMIRADYDAVKKLLSDIEKLVTKNIDSGFRKPTLSHPSLEQQEFAYAVFQWASELTSKQREIVIKRIVDAARTIVPSERFYLSWDECQRMDQEIVTFGAHGHSHNPLTWLENDVMVKELEKSKRILEENLFQPVTAMSYPHSRITLREIMAAANAGYRVAFGGRISFSRSLQAGIFNYARIGISQTTGITPRGQFSEDQFLFYLYRHLGKLKNE